MHELERTEGRQGVVKLSAVVEPVRWELGGSTSGMGEPLTAIQQRDKEYDNLVRDPGPTRGSTQGNEAASSAEGDQSSAGGSGDKDDGRVRTNTLGSCGTSRNVHFKGSQKSVHQGAHMRSGSGG